MLPSYVPFVFFERFILPEMKSICHNLNALQHPITKINKTNYKQKILKQACPKLQHHNLLENTMYN